jgi:hypothetical protein
MQWILIGFPESVTQAYTEFDLQIQHYSWSGRRCLSLVKPAFGDYEVKPFENYIDR